ncbi:helix-hairpin-helix domain-containing protein [Zooshikella harenae]|uniref:Helix-hairpin-helix domain-containing protein n=1 Tax=Zooshikella harenae TaxID=2827238 RepID=A0ABS5ZIU5_9GAMM|nr:helix-hairpin-helix domain-containing protein [Zooshikella harenae]MBU2712917.1 helix-hairpin-helix domain-containing protein [Zooshikella harenae]
MFKKLFSWFSAKTSEDNTSDKTNNNSHLTDQQDKTHQVQENIVNNKPVIHKPSSEDIQAAAVEDESQDKSTQFDSIGTESSEQDEDIKQVTATQEKREESPIEPQKLAEDGAFVFAANLTLYTSLDVLQLHGKHVEELPEESTQKKNGEWINSVDFALRSDENGMFKSDIGFVEESEYLAFLITCREIVESNLAYEKKLEALSAKMDANPLWNSWGQRKLKNKEDWISDLIIKEETRVITGLSLANAKTLFNQGYTSLDAIATAPDEVLISLPRVGKKTLENIRQAVS